MKAPEPPDVPVFIRTADGEPLIPLPDYIVQVVEQYPRAAQVWRELNLRAHELGCLDMPNGRQVLMEDDVYNMLIELLVGVMLEESPEAGHFPGER